MLLLWISKRGRLHDSLFKSYENSITLKKLFVFCFCCLVFFHMSLQFNFKIEMD